MRLLRRFTRNPAAARCAFGSRASALSALRRLRPRARRCGVVLTRCWRIPYTRGAPPQAQQRAGSWCLSVVCRGRRDGGRPSGLLPSPQRARRHLHSHGAAVAVRRGAGGDALHRQQHSGHQRRRRRVPLLPARPGLVPAHGARTRAAPSWSQACRRCVAADACAAAEAVGPVVGLAAALAAVERRRRVGAAWAGRRLMGVFTRRLCVALALTLQPS
jgi:hypothetical protein